MKEALIALLLVITTGITAGAAELTKTLLKELSQPHQITSLSTAPPQNKADNTSKHDESFILFTLEELKEGAVFQEEMGIADTEPAADIPLALNDKVNYFINHFQTRGRKTYANWLARSNRYMPMMQEILRKEGLPDELAYVAMIESGFRLNARSWANAVGPWQFMSATGRRYSLRIDQWVDERMDPIKATMAAAMYLKDLYSMFNNDWYLAAAGYNAGEGKISRAIKQYDTSDFWEISKGAYLKKETKDYVPKLLAAVIIAKDPAKYGFAEVASVPFVEYDTVTINSRTDLELVALLTDTSYQTIKELNPALLHWSTPPNYPNYELHIPKGTKERLKQGLVAIPKSHRFSEKPLYSRYTAKEGDTLKQLADRFESTPAELAKLNGLYEYEQLAGLNLIVPVKHPVNFVQQGRVVEQADVVPAAITYYTVRKGDTLYSLARRFNVSVKLLTTWNNIKNVVALKPGKRLIVAKNDTLSDKSQG